MNRVIKTTSNDPETLQKVKAYLSDAKRQSGKWHDKITKRRRLYNMDHYSGNAKEGEDRFQDPTYTNMVDMVVGILLANGLEWVARGWVPSSMEQRDSSHIEKFLSGLLYRCSEREQISIPYEVLLHFARDGAAVLYSVWDNRIAVDSFEAVMVPDEREENPTGVREVGLYKEPPVTTQVIDPLKIFVVPGGNNRWLQIMRVEEQTIYDVELTYRVTFDKYRHLTVMQKMKKPMELIDFWCYSDEDQPTGEIDEMGEPVMAPKRVVKNALLFADQVIKPLEIMEGYEEIPYVIGFFKPVDRSKPEDWGHSIIDPLEPSISMLEKSTNRRSRQILLYSSMPLVVKSNRKLTIDKAIGATLNLQPQEDVGFPTWPGNPPDVKQHIDFLTARVQQSGFSDVMFGTGDAVSGYALNQLGDQNRIRLQQPREHLQMFWSRWASQVLKLTAALANDAVVRVFGRMRGMDFMDQIFTQDLASYYVQCKVRPEFPNDKTRNHAMATQARGVLSETTLMERYYEIEQPDDERQRKLQEMAETHPTMLQYALIKKLRAMSAEGDMDAALTIQLLTSQGAGGGQPPQGAGQSRPEQMVGMPSPNGQPTPQEGGGLPPGQGDMADMNRQATAAPGMDGMVQ